MSKLEWDDIYSVGVAGLDEEHKVLFDYINDLRDSLLGKKGKDTVKKVLDGLIAYTNDHFFHEEIMLYKSGYPDYERHKVEHERLIAEIRGLYVRFHADDAESKLISAEIIAIITEWLQEHIVKIDKQYSAFLNSKGIK
ncbi:MAG: hemerythrin family protein [Nitrospinae bacterium]|nr:hemerythrin family protein [Nitrospinota bacterium]